MITLAQLTELSRMRSSPEEPIVTLYLNIDRMRHDRRGHRAVLKDLIRNVEDQVVEKRAWRAVERDLDRIASFLEYRLEPSGRGLVVFSCAAKGLWQDYQLPIPIGDMAYLDTVPYLKPLLKTLDEYPRYGVVVVDKERARFFTLHLGNMVEYDQILSPIPRKHKQSGWPRANYQRYHQARVLGHLKSVSDSLARQLVTTGIDRLVIGGTDEVTAELVRLLPKPIAGRVSGTFSMSPSAAPSRVHKEVEAIHSRQEQSRKRELVESLVVTAKKGGPAVLGVDDTLTALNWGRAWQLVIAEDVQLPGYSCPDCHRLATSGGEPCGACGAALVPTLDLTGKVIQAALKEEVKVEVVGGSVAATLASHGAVGAFLRL